MLFHWKEKCENENVRGGKSISKEIFFFFHACLVEGHTSFSHASSTLLH